MSSFGEKMRQMRDRLKSAGEHLHRTARATGQDAAQALQRAVRWPGAWWTGRRTAQIEPTEPAWGEGPREMQAVADAAAEGPSAAAGWRDRHPTLVKGLRIAAIALAVFLALPYIFILIYRFVDPPISALMLRHALLGHEIRHQWVDFDAISPNLATAAIIAEDARFCSHWGVDWGAVGEVLDDLEIGETPRGASTIAMQTAKNLFLWPEQIYIRKVLEVPLAYFMTLVWPRQRIIEIYLNIAEWGPDVFGAEAAAEDHFGKSAASLSRREAALLVAALPNPYIRNAGRPGPKTRRLASRIQSRVNREAQDASCVFAR